MNTNSNGYTLIYATVMVVIVALMLALVSGSLKDKQDANVRIDKKKQILSSLMLTTEGQDAEAMYDKYITGAEVINSKGQVLSTSKEKAFDIDVKKELSKKLENRQLPIYIANVDGQTKYIIPLMGTGLWGAIWGYIALNQDKSTVYGTYFSDEGETPGLGANIANRPFQKEFIGHHILNAQREFVSIAVMKAGKFAQGKEQVDALAGATITSKGVQKMLKDCMSQYDAFYNQKSIGGDK